jgi:hypothetical protein
VIGETVETLPNQNIITGKVKTKAEKVIEIAVLISKTFGKNLKILLKNFSV